MDKDPFPPSDFDEWAAGYDLAVHGEAFPFTGYRRVLAEVVRSAAAGPGVSVLDLGAGTGNLSAMFASSSCELWCTDFSQEMLERARAKLPSARCFLHDLRQTFPPHLARRFDRIVSAYVFHHFEFEEKLAIIRRLVRDHLAQRGRLVVADISFPTPEALDACRQYAVDLWEDEPYWIAAQSVPALESMGASVSYTQISECAGVYMICAAAQSNMRRVGG